MGSGLAIQDAKPLTTEDTLLCATCLNFCEEAYEDEELFYDMNGVQVYLHAEATGNLYIAFRGSDEFLDWRRNFWCIKKTLNAGYVHSGLWFAAEYHAPVVEAAIERWLAVTAFTNPRVIVTGHSAGGAAALLQIAALVDKKSTLLERVDFTIVTVAAPRCVDVILENKICEKAKVFRLAHPLDLVPRLPPSWLGFTHVGMLVPEKSLDFPEPFEDTSEVRCADVVERALLHHDLYTYRQYYSKA